MATATRPDAVVPPVRPLFALDAFVSLADAFVRAQRLQWETLVSWQQSLAGLQKELWDEWVCRWAGGAPIDA